MAIFLIIGELMVKLRTLKELQDDGKYGGMGRCEYECQKAIKKEAIRHIKYLESYNGNYKKDSYKLMEQAQADWIRYFFNVPKRTMK
jgi:hypothetical protein